MNIADIIQDLFILNDDEFIKRIYKEFLDVSPSIEVLNYYTSSLKFGTKPYEIFRDVVLSDDFANKFDQSHHLYNLFQLLMKKDGYEFIKALNYDFFSKNLTLYEMQNQMELFNYGINKKFTLKKFLLNEDFINMLIDIKKLDFVPQIQNKFHEIFQYNGKTFFNKIFQEFLNRYPMDCELGLEDKISKIEIYKSIVTSCDFDEMINKYSYQSILSISKDMMKYDYDVFVTKVYNECLMREPDLDGLNHHVNLLRNGASKLDILRIVLLCDEAKEKYYSKTLTNRNRKIVENNLIWPEVSIDNNFRTYVQNIFMKNKFPFSTSILVKTGGLGDFIQMTPVAKALKSKNPKQPVVAIVGFASSLFDEHPYIDLTIECGGMGLYEVVKSVCGLSENVFDLRYVSRAYGLWEETDFFTRNKWYYHYFPNSGFRVEDLNMNVCDLMLHSLGLEKYATSNDVCVIPLEVKEKIPKDYVIVCNTAGSGAGQMKRWTKKEWDSLIQWLISQNIIPVQLGKETDSLLNPFVMDLRGETTPREAAGYLKEAKAYIGLEGGLFHLAKAVNTPAIVIFASTSDICFAYSDTIVISKKLCHPCWWTENWLNSKCLRNCKSCLNLPSWEDVADVVSKVIMK